MHNDTQMFSLFLIVSATLSLLVLIFFGENIFELLHLDSILPSIDLNASKMEVLQDQIDREVFRRQIPLVPILLIVTSLVFFGFKKLK